MARRVQIKRGSSVQTPTLRSTVVPTQSTAGARPPAATNSMLELSKALSTFNPELRRYVDITDRKKIAEDLAKGQAQALGIQYEGTKEAISKLVRSGELPAGSSPVMALGLLAQRGQNRAQAAHVNLMNNVNGFSDPSKSLSEAADFADQSMGEELGVVASDPLVLNAISGIVSNSKASFLRAVIKARTEAFEQEAQSNLDFRVADVVDAFSELEPDASDEDTEAAQNVVSNQLKELVKEFRGIGYKDTNRALAQTIANQALRIAEDDVDEARALIDLAENLDVTGKGGLLGSVSGNIPIFRNAHANINSIESGNKKKPENKSKLLDAFQVVAQQAAAEKRGITDEELTNLTQVSDEIFPKNLSAGRGELNRLFNAFNSPVSESKSDLSEMLLNSALTMGAEGARATNMEAFKSGEITTGQFLNNEKFIGAIRDTEKVFIVDNDDSRETAFSEVEVEFPGVPLAFEDKVSLKDELTTDFLELARPLAEEANQPVSAFIDDPANAHKVESIKKEAMEKLKENSTNILQKKVDIQKAKDDKALEELEAFRAANPRLVRAAASRKPGFFAGWFGDEASLLENYSLLSRKIKTIEDKKADEKAVGFGPLNNVPTDLQFEDVQKHIKKLEDELAADIISVNKDGDKEEYFRLKGILGYSALEIADGWTAEGNRIDRDTIDPVNTLLFKTKDEFEKVSDEDFAKLAESFGLSEKRFGAIQVQLLRERGRLTIKKKNQ